MYKMSLVWGLFFLGIFITPATATAQECTAYCVCNGTSSVGCSKGIDECTAPATALCVGGTCATKPICCCSERIFQPSEDGEGGTIVLRVSKCENTDWCQEMCGGPGFLVHGDADELAHDGEGFAAILREIRDPIRRERRSRLANWALVEIEMTDGRELNYQPIYASSTRYALEGARTSGLENYMSPGHSTRLFMKEMPPGAIPREFTVDKKGLRTHLLKTLGDEFLELEGADMSLTIVLGIDGAVESTEVLFSEPEEFAELLVPELERVFSQFSGHAGNGRTMDVFSPNVHTDGTMLGLHHGGSYLLDVHPHRH